MSASTSEARTSEGSTVEASTVESSAGERVAAVPAPRELPGRALLTALWRGKLTVALVFVLVSGAVAFATLTTPPLYDAESSLVVRIGREYAYRPETGPNETVRTPSLSEMVNSEVEILASRDLAETVVRALGVAALYPELLELEPDPERAVERAVLQFRAATSVRPVLESSVIKVGFEHVDPRLAAEAVNWLVERLADKHVEVFGEEGADRLQAELARRATELATAEQALAEFKRANGVSDLDQQRNLLLARHGQLEQELEGCEQELAALPPTPPADEAGAPIELPAGLRPDMQGEILRQRYELERERRALDDTGNDWLVEQASMRALDLELEERRLLRDYNESSRRVQGVRDSLEHVRSFLNDAEHRAAEHEVDLRAQRTTRAQDLEGEIARLDDQLRLLGRVELQREQQLEREHARVLALHRDDTRRRITDTDEQLATLERSETALRQLERVRAAAEAALATCAERADDARISAELDRERLINVRVIERAAPPVAPVGLPREVKLALGAFLGLLAGAGSVVLLDLFRSSA